MEKRKILCIYHENCPDGFTAAWVVWRRFPQAEFVPASYGDAPPDVRGKDVIIVDFSYRRDVLLDMAKTANSILVLDHHKTAEEDLKDFLPPEGGLPELWNAADNTQKYDPAPVRVLFDMNRSGARIAWDFLAQEQFTMPLILHVEDRDLWRFDLENTREIMAYVMSWPMTWENWSSFSESTMDHLARLDMIASGSAILRQHNKDVEGICRTGKREMTVGGFRIWAVNAPPMMASDAGHLLCNIEPPVPVPQDGQKFSAVYWDGPHDRKFSLRSVGDFDVSEIAKQYGGGGHKNAAGFKVPLGWYGDEKQ